eukprot:1445377-Amphidinium_carterae.1
MGNHPVYIPPGLPCLNQTSNYHRRMLRMINRGVHRPLQNPSKSGETRMTCKECNKMPLTILTYTHTPGLMTCRISQNPAQKNK